jgi:hypothetical protein
MGKSPRSQEQASAGVVERIGQKIERKTNMDHKDITVDIFELAFRRYSDDSGRSYDQYDIFARWARFKNDPLALEEQFGYLKPFLPGGEQYNAWIRGR